MAASRRRLLALDEATSGNDRFNVGFDPSGVIDAGTGFDTINVSRRYSHDLIQGPYFGGTYYLVKPDSLSGALVYSNVERVYFDDAVIDWHERYDDPHAGFS